MVPPKIIGIYAPDVFSNAAATNDSNPLRADD